MGRWGQTAHSSVAVQVAQHTYRPCLLPAALRDFDVAMPSANAKVEGALAAARPVASSTGKLVLGPDGFFDGASFDPALLDEYIAGFQMRAELPAGILPTSARSGCAAQLGSIRSQNGQDGRSEAPKGRHTLGIRSAKRGVGDRG